MRRLTVIKCSVAKTKIKSFLKKSKFETIKLADYPIQKRVDKLCNIIYIIQYEQYTIMRNRAIPYMTYGGIRYIILVLRE